MKQMSDFSRRLLVWYSNNRRILPWREDPSPYHVWLSEIMLQQTRVEAVIRYYERFLKTLPSVEALADADEDTCLKLWEGLGYYSRVRNLHRASAQVMETFGGEIPSDPAQLRSLPGIGTYTAAAISSIAFGKRVPAVDGNLLRVFSRLRMYEENIKSPEALRAATAFFEEMMPDEPQGGKGDNLCGNFNQALMDLGAMICLPNARPKCEECPLSASCRVHTVKRGSEDALPVMPARRDKKTEKLTVFLIRSGERTAVLKRPSRGLLAGLYEFPNARGHLDVEEARDWLRQHSVDPVRITRLCDSEHVFTHKIWQMKGYEVKTDPFFDERIPFIMADKTQIAGQYCIPSAFGAYLKELGI